MGNNFQERECGEKSYSHFNRNKNQKNERKKMYFYHTTWGNLFAKNWGNQISGYRCEAERLI
jgi:hypothetical protein